MDEARCSRGGRGPGLAPLHASAGPGADEGHQPHAHPLPRLRPQWRQRRLGPHAHRRPGLQRPRAIVPRRGARVVRRGRSQGRQGVLRGPALGRRLPARPRRPRGATPMALFASTPPPPPSRRPRAPCCCCNTPGARLLSTEYGITTQTIIQKPWSQLSGVCSDGTEYLIRSSATAV